MALRSLRAKMLAAVVAAVAIALAAGVIGSNALLRSRLDADATDIAHQRAALLASSIVLREGHIRVIDLPGTHGNEALEWVFEGTRTVEAPRRLGQLKAAAQDLVGGTQKTTDFAGRIRLASVSVAGGRGTAVAGVSLVPYRRTESEALTTSILLAGLILAVVALAAALALRSALRPVARMTADAAAWSEHDLERRIGMGRPYDEISQLGNTLDGLLDRLAESLRRERRFSAEISHELRTPLAKIAGEAELALRREREPASYRESLASILRYAHDLTRTADTLLAASREETRSSPRASADPVAAATAVVARCSGTSTNPTFSISVKAPGLPVSVGLDADMLERILQPVVDNACHYGRTEATITIANLGDCVTIQVRDDGPGVSVDERERIFNPGARGTASTHRPGNTSGAGLGLALARRLARACAGDVKATPDPNGGHFTIRLPRSP